MSSIVPPLDYIPKLPGIGVNLIIQQLNKLIDELIDKLSKLLQDVLKLTDNIKCDDPRIKKIKAALDDIMKLIKKVQDAIPKIQKTIDTIKQIVSIAKQVKNAITIAQLSNPITAAAFIAGQLMLIQDATIVNAVEALKQFQTVPPTVISKLEGLVPQLLTAVSAINLICNGDDPVPPIQLPPEIINGTGDVTLPIDDVTSNDTGLSGDYSIIQTKKLDTGYWLLRVVITDTLNNAVEKYKIGSIVTLNCPTGQKITARVISNASPLTESVFCLETLEKLKSICPKNNSDVGINSDDTDYNDLLGTEFYTEFNVSEQDLDFRSDTIEEVLKQQLDLLKSIQEAPSQVIQGAGVPNVAIGKAGDYYIDTQTQQIYGPKPSINSWT